MVFPPALQALPGPFTLGHRQLVAAVVFGVVGVALNPVVAHFMLCRQHKQLLPEVRVQGGLLVGLDPAPLLPAPGPALFQGVNDVLGVGIDRKSVV